MERATYRFPAMHIPDGFLSTPVWVTLDALAVPSIGWLARRAPSDDRRIPLLGVMGAFVFAAQMINFPVGLGTSGHLVGGALLAVVLGMEAAAIVMTAILILQAVVFQDGGILTLGANICNMAFAGVAAGYLPCRLWGRTRAAVFAGGVLSVMVSASLALSQLLLSGVALPPRLVWISLGLFLISALTEGAITVAAVAAIERMNPRGLSDPLFAGSRVAAAMALAAVVLLTGGMLAASTHPDGLQNLIAGVPQTWQSPGWLSAPLGGLFIVTICVAGGRLLARRSA